MRTLAIITLLLLTISLTLALPGYESPKQGFSASGNIQIQDTAIYNKAYVSTDGTNWQERTLTGNTQRGNWIIGQATNNQQLTEIRYIAAYSCTWNNAWNCTDTWQVLDRGEQTTPTPWLDSQEGDEQALQELFTASNGMNWHTRRGWSANNMNLSQPIYGVEVTEKNGQLRVTEIDLRNNSLTGSIDVATLANLKELELFNVMFNELESHFPTALTQATKLKYLYLSGSDGTVDLIANHPHEQNTKGSGRIHPGKHPGNEKNNIFGEIPDDIDNLKQLEWIMISWSDSYNRTNSNGHEYMNEDGISYIPMSLWNISSLRGVLIYENWNIAGTGNTFSFPKRISHIENLTILQLGGGSGSAWDRREQKFMVGTYPEDLGELEHVLQFAVSRNADLYGMPNFSKSTGLMSLGLQATSLGGGPFPSWFADGSLPKLDSASLGHPQGEPFTGELPEFGSMPGLDLYSVTGHQLTGSIPESFWHTNPRGIRKSNFGNNQFTSVGTQNLTHLRKSNHFRWYGNNISESLPYVNWQDPPPINIIYIQSNNYLFKHLLEIPPNAPNEETIFELYKGLTDRFRYAPQKPFGTSATYTLSAGQSITVDDFSTLVEHKDNEYQWLRNEEVLAGETQREITVSQEGEYVLQVNNPGVPDLTLYSKPITLVTS